MDLVRTLITIVLFFVILGLLVLVHEVGHFVVARLFRIRVLEFGVGFPPRARVLRDAGETLYTLNWLPIGGFVKLESEDGDEARDPRSFASQGLLRQLIVLLAGVVMNVILAGAIFTGMALTGDPAIGVYVPFVQPDSPAAAAGVQVGDVIERIDGRAYSFFGPDSVLTALRDRAGQTVVLTIRRSDATMDLSVPLRSPADVAAGKGALGIGAQGYPLEGRGTPDRITHPFGEAIGLGGERTVGAMRLIVDGVGQLLTAIVTHPTEAPPASGPVGIATQIGDVFWSMGPLVTLYLAGLLSANLAVVNFLPFPPLDGGRMLMLILKRVLGSRLSLRAERMTYALGMVMILTFLVWTTGFDIVRQLTGK
jgi:regulator of sigma E protease